MRIEIEAFETINADVIMTLYYGFVAGASASIAASTSVAASIPITTISPSMIHLDLNY